MFIRSSVFVLISFFMSVVAAAQGRLTEIIDYDSAGRFVVRRADVVFDANQRRESNKVFDAKGRLMATETFTYEVTGRLARREYRVADDRVKWQWANFEYDETGKEKACDILNGKGKKIGKCVWRYDKQGKFVRRDRYNADGSLRFYYADIGYDEQGNFAKWVRYESQDKRIGWKTWKYRPVR